MYFSDEIDPVMVIINGAEAEFATLFTLSFANPLVWLGLILLLCFFVFGVVCQNRGK